MENDIGIIHICSKEELDYNRVFFDTDTYVRHMMAVHGYSERVAVAFVNNKFATAEN